MEHEKTQRLTDFFRVLGNEQRLRIAAHLMECDCTVSELAQRFQMKELAVQDSLAVLRLINLVSAVHDGKQTRYRFDLKALYALNRDLLSRENQPSPVDDLENDAERNLLRPFFNGQRLMEIPTNGKKFSTLLKWLAAQFETGMRYNEKQVNEIITRYHEDYATLRRAMIDQNLMQREKSIYWRVS